MTGEHTHAKKIIENALEIVHKTPSMDAEAQLFALLSNTIEKLLATRSKPDLESFIQYEFENYNGDAPVITRGC